MVLSKIVIFYFDVFIETHFSHLIDLLSNYFPGLEPSPLGHVRASASVIPSIPEFSLIPSRRNFEEKSKVQEKTRQIEKAAIKDKEV